MGSSEHSTHFKQVESEDWHPRLFFDCHRSTVTHVYPHPCKRTFTDVHIKEIKTDYVILLLNMQKVTQDTQEKKITKVQSLHLYPEVKKETYAYQNAPITVRNCPRAFLVLSVSTLPWLRFVTIWWTWLRIVRQTSWSRRCREHAKLW